MTLLTDAEAWSKAHWDELKNSNTIRALVSLETASIAAFIKGVFDGSQGFDFHSLKLWALLQAGIILAFLVRHTLAGIELRLKGFVGPDTVKAVEDTIIKRIAAKNVGLADAVQEHLADNT